MPFNRPSFECQMSLTKPFDLLEPCLAHLVHGTVSEGENGRKRGTQVPLQQEGGGKRTRQIQLFGTFLSVLNPVLFSVATPEDGLFPRSITHDEQELAKYNLSFVPRCVLVHKDYLRKGLSLRPADVLEDLAQREVGGWGMGVWSKLIIYVLRDKHYGLRKLPIGR